MTTARKIRGGTTTQHSTFIGLDREITVDTNTHRLCVHDGTTAGGHPQALESEVQPATTESTGVVELATPAEAEAHTISDKAVTPAGLLDIYTKLQGILTDGWLFDSLRFLGGSLPDLISGEMIGEEGPWNIIYVGEFTPNSELYFEGDSAYAGDFTFLYDNTLTAAITYGSSAHINEDTIVFTIDDTGEPVLGFFANTASDGIGRGFGAYPHHGDIRGNFTSDGAHAYPLLVMQEDIANKTSGTKTMTDYIPGSSLTSLAEIYSLFKDEFTDIAPDPDFSEGASRPLKKSIFPVFTPKTCSPQQLA
jgi:hypothetical protein